MFYSFNSRSVFKDRCESASAKYQGTLLICHPETLPV